jgi:NitT/TauT family transport system permease protein
MIGENAIQESTGPGAKAKRIRFRISPPILIFIAGVTLWEVLIFALDVPPWLMPAPSSVVWRLFHFPSVWYHTGLTVLEAIIGFCISAILGVAVSAAIVHSRFLEEGLHPYIVLSNSIPIVAIVPLLTIWFGFGMTPKIMIVAIISFFPIVTNTTRGLKAVDYRIMDFMRSINATGWETFIKVQLPSALPYIFAGFKIGASLSLVGAVVGEFYSSDRGLGYLVITSASQLRTDILFVCITILATLGVTVFYIFSRLESVFARGEVAREN